MGNLRNIPPVALLSKNPYRQSLIGEKSGQITMTVCSKIHEKDILEKLGERPIEMY